ncbi:MAG TPA: cytochrome b/b6 domain-containing protein [Rhizomicrobium sp.]|nr:cytochrome b/b6 domain-containing protein [Rhizomicrobium sp.]
MVHADTQTGAAHKTGGAMTGGVWAAVLRFLSYGPQGGGPRISIFRHPVMVRITHWVNAGIIIIMFMSGLQIFNAHPALYWGSGSNFDAPALSMTGFMENGEPKGVTQIGNWKFDTTGVLGASKVDGVWNARGFPDWMTLPGPQWLAMGRLWHFFFAWLFVINAAAFVIYAAWRGHLRALVPRWLDIKHLPREIADHARLRFARGAKAREYNALQKLTYFIVIFVLGPLIVLTGLTMSPTMAAALHPLLWMFGGRQSARTIHFICAFSFFGFFIVHIIMVVLSGTWNNLRSMITGHYEIETGKAGGDHG